MNDNTEIATDLTPGVDGGAPPPAPPSEPEATPAPREAEPQVSDSPNGKRMSVRESLMKAFDEAKQEPGARAPKEPKQAAPKASEGERARGPDGKFLPSEQAAAAGAAANEGVPKAPAQVPEPKKDAQAAGDQKPSGPPPGWSPEAKSAWTTLPPAIQAAVLKREEEVSGGFKQKADELKKLQDDLKQNAGVAEVFAPHQELFRQHGRTNADVAKQLMGWFQLLSHNSPAVRQNGLQLLASSFNIPGIQAPAPVAPAQTPAATEPQNPALPPEMQAYLERTIQSAVSPLQQQFQQQQQSQVNGHINTWAADKPHFQTVRPMMGALIQSGQVPMLPDGRPDLDVAYQMATRANPTVFAEMQRAEQEKAAAEAEKKRQEDEQKAAEKAAADRQKADEEAARVAKEKAEKLAQAKKAGSSVTSSAPRAPSSGANGANPRKRMSVRESLMAAMEESRA